MVGKDRYPDQGGLIAKSKKVTIHTSTAIFFTKIQSQFNGKRLSTNVTGTIKYL